MPLKTD